MIRHTKLYYRKSLIRFHKMMEPLSAHISKTFKLEHVVLRCVGEWNENVSMQSQWFLSVCQSASHHQSLCSCFDWVSHITFIPHTSTFPFLNRLPQQREGPGTQWVCCSFSSDFRVLSLFNTPAYYCHYGKGFTMEEYCKLLPFLHDFTLTQTYWRRFHTSISKTSTVLEMLSR